jgi:tripeptide aminopeptidase
MANRLRVEVIGKEAHAGIHPEQGINAICLACKAIAQIDWGRIDEETTCNVGVILGGRATNIVPNKVVLDGEVRSHKREKLEAQTKKIVTAFEGAIANVPPQSGLPRLNIDVKNDYPLMNVADDHPLIKLLQQAGKEVGLDLFLRASGGGSDANIFNSVGIISIVIGCGMKNVHTCEEYISLADMGKMANLLWKIVTK